MEREEKELLKDLCARLPYGVFVADFDENGNRLSIPAPMTNIADDESFYGNLKPYLRPMSSMTEEEEEELYEVSGLICYDGLFTCKKLAKEQSFIADTTDWLNAHHFDYRGLIEKGLALKAPEGMYKI